jgi:twitching motility two-component system response regulator PilH
MSRILVVDDSPTMLHIISQMLAEGNHNMLSAMDGEQAVRLASEQRPDLILLDVILPKLNGYQVCRQLRSLPETAHIPVVMITRKARDEDREWGVEQGADAYVTKPFVAQDLLNAIQKFIPTAG